MNHQSLRECVVLGCRVRVICYGGLRWTPWTPWGSWLWPVRPADSPPPLPPTPHPPPSQQTITTPPTPCPAAGAALTATGASEASAVAGVNVGGTLWAQTSAAPSSPVCRLRRWGAAELSVNVCLWSCLFGCTELMKDGENWPALMLLLHGVLLMCKRKPASAQSYDAQRRGINVKHDCAFF